MGAVRGLLAAVVLASVPWQGVAYPDHVGWRNTPILGGAFVVHRRWHVVPVCIHMDWRGRESPPKGAVFA